MDGLDGVELVCADGVLGEGGAEGTGEGGVSCSGAALAAVFGDDAVGTAAGAIFGAIQNAKEDTVDR